MYTIRRQTLDCADNKRQILLVESNHQFHNRWLSSHRQARQWPTFHFLSIVPSISFFYLNWSKVAFMMEKIWSLGPVACGMYFIKHQMIKNKGRKRQDTFHTLAVFVSVQFVFPVFLLFLFHISKNKNRNSFSLFCRVCFTAVRRVNRRRNKYRLPCLPVCACVGMRWWSVSWSADQQRPLSRHFWNIILSIYFKLKMCSYRR